MIEGSEKPRMGSWIAVSILLAGVLLDGIRLPFRLVLFLFRRKAVAAGIREMITREG